MEQVGDLLVALLFEHIEVEDRPVAVRQPADHRQQFPLGDVGDIGLLIGFRQVAERVDRRGRHPFLRAQPHQRLVDGDAAGPRLQRTGPPVLERVEPAEYLDEDILQQVLHVLVATRIATADRRQIAVVLLVKRTLRSGFPPAKRVYQGFLFLCRERNHPFYVLLHQMRISPKPCVVRENYFPVYSPANRTAPVVASVMR